MRIANAWQLYLITWILLNVQGCAFGQEQPSNVFITRTGAKYHRQTCRYLKYSSYKITLKEAKERGYTACLVCKPEIESGEEEASPASSAPDRDNHVSGPANRTEEETVPESPPTASPRQCSALTKSGLRCKRMTSEANGKCWQHQ